ncbi:MAG: hypothetical protein ACLFSQ_07230 [Candidatus Zixiibacteriota bacterium]
MGILFFGGCIGRDSEEPRLHLRVDNAPIFLIPGDSAFVAANLFDSNNNIVDCDIEYVSNINQIASFDENGIIFAKSTGIFDFQIIAQDIDTTFFAYITELPISHIDISPSPFFVRSNDTATIDVYIFDIEENRIILPEIPAYLRIKNRHAILFSQQSPSSFKIEGIDEGFSIVEASLNADFDCIYADRDTIFVIDMPNPPGVNCY